MAQPLRIAHIAQQLDIGGMERLLAEFARHADRSLIKPCFVAMGQRGRVAEDIEASGCDVIALDEPAGLRPKTMYRLARLFRERAIDIVHTHNTKPLLYAGPAARLAGVGGVVHTRHGRRHGATPRQNFFFRLAARCADRVVCVSRDSARLCLSDGIDERSVCTVPNGIDLERFPFSGPKPLGPAVFVGRLTPEKDIATLLHAVARMVQHRPLFRLVVAGGGVCEPELKDLAVALGITDRVEFRGDVRDVGALLRDASLFVLPSITEGLPLTVLEAMACGLPVVATAVGGTPEAVVNGVTGLLVPAGDPAALADALVRIHSNAGSAGAMGLAGRRRAEEMFDVRRMARQYEAIYLDILNGRAALAA